jgi:predicted HicB family RNase H-like nuclease
MSMRNVLEIDGHKAVICYDPEIQMFRGEFVGLNGGADFVATDVAGLLAEGKASLKVFLEVCAERGIDPVRQFSGKLNLRIDDLHEDVATAAAARGVSINHYIVTAVRHELEADAA